MKAYDTNVQVKQGAEREARQDRGRLVHLDDVKDRFKVAEGNPDIRGWEVKTSDGRKIGKVDGLLIDTGKQKVRYLEVKVNKDMLDSDDDRWVLCPIGGARLDDDKDEVTLDIASSDIPGMLMHRHEQFSEHDERSLHDRFRSGKNEADRAPARGNRDDMYGGDIFDERRFLGTRGGRGKASENQGYLVPIAVVEEVIVARDVVPGDQQSTSRTGSSGADTRQSSRTTEGRSEAH